MVDFATGKLGDQYKEGAIYDVIEVPKICRGASYINNTDVDLKGVNPVIIPEACQAIIASYEDELVAVLRRRHAFADINNKKAVRKHVRERFCTTVTRACHNVDKSQLNMEIVEGQNLDKVKRQHQGLLDEIVNNKNFSDDPEIVKLGERMK